MKILLNLKSKFLIIFILLISTQMVHSDNHNIYEVLEIIKKDLKTLERAVYSDGLDDGSNKDDNLTELDHLKEQQQMSHHMKIQYLICKSLFF